MHFDFDYFLLKCENFYKEHIITIVVALLAVVLGIGYLGVREVITYNKVVAMPSKIKDDAKQNNKNFSILGKNITKQADGTIVITYDLFMKKPFTNANTINSQLSQFCDTVKDKYNASSIKPKVRGIGIRLYDRKLVYDMGLTPRGTAMYAMDPDYASQIATKQNKKQAKNQGKDNNVAQIDPATGKQQGVITSNTSLSPVQIAWKETLDTKNKVNYDKWTLTTYGIQSYSKSNISKPLSNKEFAFWLKLKEYEALLGSDNIDSAVQLYLNYDLDGLTDENDFIEIAKSFEKFNDRENNLGDSTNYFPNTVLLRQYAAIYRPQLLYYILSNGTMVKDYRKAQEKLVNMSPDMYAQPIKQHMQEVANHSDSYGKINYYVKYINGKEENTDPFSGQTGKLRNKMPLYFERPQFSPLPIMNNAWYPQQSSNFVSGQDTDNN